MAQQSAGGFMSVHYNYVSIHISQLSLSFLNMQHSIIGPQKYKVHEGIRDHCLSCLSVIILKDQMVIFAMLKQCPKYERKHAAKISLDVYLIFLWPA